MARRKPAQVHGLLVVDKPRGCTSHDVVDRVRRVLGERKVGHSGTLDPDATGVLLVGVGDATRLLRFLDMVFVDGEMTTLKTYRGSIVLGTETDSLDSTGTVTATHDMEAIVESLTLEGVQSLVDRQFRGPIMQVPPMVSAIRVDGRRLHELAREGVEIDRAARPVTVHDLRILAVRGPVIDIEVSCTSGTFVRTLAADIGRALGGGAHLHGLRRTVIGRFTLDEAVTLDELESLGGAAARNVLLPVVSCVRGLSTLAASDDLVAAVAVGKVLPASLFTGPPPWAVIARLRPGTVGGEHSGDVPGQSLGAPSGQLLAVYEPFANERVGPGMARPMVVLVHPTSVSGAAPPVASGPNHSGQ